MNWWMLVKLAMPLPEATGYPEDRSNALSRMEKRLDPENAKSVETKHPQLSYLGHGRNGVAYTTPQPNTVVKLTFDRLEAVAAKHLMERPCPCCIRVFGVEQQQNSKPAPDPMTATPAVWKITTQKVPLLSDGEEKRWLKYLAEFIFQTGSLPNPREIVSYLTDEGFYNDGLHRRGDFSFIAPYYKKYSQLIACLRENDLLPTDAHEDNIGVGEQGQYVIIDLGGLV